MTAFHILIGVDCDNDRERFNTEASETKVIWKGLKQLGHRFGEIRSAIERDSGLTPLLTLNIRADSHVYESEGSYDFCFRWFHDELYSEFSDQDEIAWHHHQWRKQGGEWIQESSDSEWIKEHIFRSYESIAQYQPRTLHTGWCFMNTVAMNAYNDVGIAFDYSALPGLAVPTGKTGRFDYSRVDGIGAFTPSRQDYQTPQNGAGDHERDNTTGDNLILEIPTSTASHKILNSLRKLDNIRRRRTTGTNPQQKSFVQINVNHLLFRPFVQAFFAENPDASHFISFFHADELLSETRASKIDSGLYPPSSFRKNLSYLIQVAESRGRQVTFSTFSQFASTFDS